MKTFYNVPNKAAKILAKVQCKQKQNNCLACNCKVAKTNFILTMLTLTTKAKTCILWHHPIIHNMKNKNLIINLAKTHKPQTVQICKMLLIPVKSVIVMT